MKPIIGKKTIIFPFDNTDMELFIKLLRLYKNHMPALGIDEKTDDELTDTIVTLVEQGFMKIFTVVTQQGKSFRKMGFTFLSDMQPHKATMHYMLDLQFLRNLDDEMKQKYTYTEDSSRAFIEYAFNRLGLSRVDVIVIKNDKLSYNLCRQCGFKREGILRKYMKVGDKLEDIIIMAITK